MKSSYIEKEKERLGMIKQRDEREGYRRNIQIGLQIGREKKERYSQSKPEC